MFATIRLEARLWVSDHLSLYSQGKNPIEVLTAIIYYSDLQKQEDFIWVCLCAVKRNNRSDIAFTQTGNGTLLYTWDYMT